MFRDRTEAGEQLSERVSALDLPDPLVLALPRGGVPVAVPVARRLGAPLDLALVRKIGVPGAEELAAGAIMAFPGGEELVFNDEVLAYARLRPADLEESVAARRRELEARRVRYRGGADPLPVAGRSVIVVDDGIATGMTVRAALRGLRRQGARKVVLAVPVAPEDTLAALRPLVDELVCLEVPSGFRAVGLHYRDFRQIEDVEVVEALRAFRGEGGSGD